MTILSPKGTTAQRWHVARERRTRRVPLDTFLHARAIAMAPPGAGSITDDLASSALYFIERATLAHEQQLGFAPLHHGSLGALTCAVNVGVARLIGEEHSWYIASLVGIGVLLAPLRGLGQSATLASHIAADYRDALGQGTDFREISDAAAEAVHADDENRVTRTVLAIMDILRLPQQQFRGTKPGAALQR